MNHHSSATNEDNADDSRGVRTVSEAREWFARLGRDGPAEVTIEEPFQVVGGGLVIVTASLRREDGARVNIAIYCFDDTPPDVVDWLPPITGDGGSGTYRAF